MKIKDPIDWREPEAISAWGRKFSPPLEGPWAHYIFQHVHPDIASAVGRLLLPAFVEHEGGVFLKEGFSLEGYSKWMAELGDLTAVEQMLNHQHVYDVFAMERIPESSFEGIAKLMVQTLRLALNTCFKERRFNIELSNTEEDYGPVVTFYSVLD